MESVRLEVRDTSRNSEKQRPKASSPPAVSVSSVYRTGESSVARNSFSELLRLSPGNETDIHHDVSLGWLNMSIHVPG